VKDPVLLQRAAAADRLTSQVIADVDASQLGSPAATRIPRQATTRRRGAAPNRAGAERQDSGIETKVSVVAELRPGPERLQADPAQPEEETGPNTQSARRGGKAPELAEAGPAALAAQAGAGAPVRRAEFPATVRVEPPARKPPAVYVSPEYGTQVHAEMDEPEIEL
jgi:hypothetical protein